MPLLHPRLDGLPAAGPVASAAAACDPQACLLLRALLRAPVRLVLAGVAASLVLTYAVAAVLQPSLAVRSPAVPMPGPRLFLAAGLLSPLAENLLLWAVVSLLHRSRRFAAIPGLWWRAAVPAAGFAAAHAALHGALAASTFPAALLLCALLTLSLQAGVRVRALACAAGLHSLHNLALLGLMAWRPGA